MQRRSFFHSLIAFFSGLPFCSVARRSEPPACNDTCTNDLFLAHVVTALNVPACSELDFHVTYPHDIVGVIEAFKTRRKVERTKIEQVYVAFIHVSSEHHGDLIIQDESIEVSRIHDTGAPTARPLNKKTAIEVATILSRHLAQRTGPITFYPGPMIPHHFGVNSCIVLVRHDVAVRFVQTIDTTSIDIIYSEPPTYEEYEVD